MIGLSLGSLLICRALFRARLIPRPIAAWGFGGNALLAIGGVLELLGHGVGIVLSAPGGLFEATLGVLLLVKGFPETQAQDVAPASVPAQPAHLRSPARYDRRAGPPGEPDRGRRDTRAVRPRRLRQRRCRRGARDAPPPTSRGPRPSADSGSPSCSRSSRSTSSSPWRCSTTNAGDGGQPSGDYGGPEPSIRDVPR